ncbi:hypothetical protein [Shinella sp. JR1-6]|uniref:hypothetical protein n=1 Tax=Shinella sp. JR1-6 TaxID=2527671 RepID=UPI001404A984|nr:hypothetical protein [Shinella sp. JR1-6]
MSLYDLAGKTLFDLRKHVACNNQRILFHRNFDNFVEKLILIRQLFQYGLEQISLSGRKNLGDDNDETRM